MPVSLIPSVIGHRGASAYAPENTIASFLKAKELGIKCIEFDVMQAACGELVVIHDQTLERTTTGRGRVIDFPYEYLKTLDAGAWFAPQFVGQRISTLKEILDFLQGSQIMVNIEVKAQKDGEEQIAYRLVELLAHYPTLMPLLSSFSLPILEYLRAASATSWLGYLMDSWQSDWQVQCDRLNCTLVGANCDILDEQKIREIKATRRQILTYTVNSTTLAKRLFALGVDSVFSDCPDKIITM